MLISFTWEQDTLELLEKRGGPDEPFVTNSLFGKLGWIKSDLLLTRIDHMSDLQIQHEVQLKQGIFISCDLGSAKYVWWRSQTLARINFLLFIISEQKESFQLLRDKTFNTFTDCNLHPWYSRQCRWWSEGRPRHNPSWSAAFLGRPAVW